MFSTPYKSACVSAILRFIFVVIVTLPGTHLIALEKVKNDHLSFHISDLSSNRQIEHATKEAEKRLNEYFSNVKQNVILQNINSNLSLKVKLVSTAQLDHSMATFQKNGKEQNILINQNWVTYGLTDEAITRSIIEQAGVAIDQALHGKSQQNKAYGKELANELCSYYEN